MEDLGEKEIASQLRCPSGQVGSEIGVKLYETNHMMIAETIKSLRLDGPAKVLEIGHGSSSHIAQLFTKNSSLFLG